MSNEMPTPISKGDNEDLVNAAVDYWAAALVRNCDPQPEKVQKFRDTLSDMIRKELVGASDSRIIQMRTDYFPEGLLANALEQSGLDRFSNLGFKDGVNILVGEGKVTQRKARGIDTILFSRTPEVELPQVSKQSPSSPTL